MRRLSCVFLVVILLYFRFFFIFVASMLAS